MDYETGTCPNCGGRLYYIYCFDEYYVRHKSVHAETGELMVVYSEIDLNSSNGWGALKNETYVMPYDVFINNLEK